MEFHLKTIKAKILSTQTDDWSTESKMFMNGAISLIDITSGQLWLLNLNMVSCPWFTFRMVIDIITDCRTWYDRSNFTWQNERISRQGSEFGKR